MDNVSEYIANKKRTLPTPSGDCEPRNARQTTPRDPHWDNRHRVQQVHKTPAAAEQQCWTTKQHIRLIAVDNASTES
jgi:hypothetical protein